MINYRNLWVGLYVLSALIAAIFFGFNGKLDGDFVGILLPDKGLLVIATICVIASYIIWMGPVFRAIEKVSVTSFFTQKPRKDGLPNGEKYISLFVLILQLLFAIYFLIEGVGVAGSTRRADTWLKYIWVTFPPDAIFLVYYGLCRKSRWFLPNLSIYVLSNFLRGWLGFWMIVMFIEGAYQFREKKVSWKKILVLIVPFVWIVPYLITFKWKIRGFGISYLTSANNVFSAISETDWWWSISNTIATTLMRLQHLDSVIVIISNATSLSENLKNREFLYVFEEGLPQFTIERLLNITRIPDIHLKLLDYFAVHRPPEGVISNTHPGLVGWFWMLPGWCSVVYIGYVLLLSLSGVWLAKKLGESSLLIEIVWFAWLGWLMNGWFAAYIEFMQAIIVMILLRIMIERSANFRFVSSNGH